MKNLYLSLIALLLTAISFQHAQGQNQFENDLPKHPTLEERVYMQERALAKLQAEQNRGPQPQAVREAGSCVDNCNGQAPSGCWCDALCATYGDCCDDYVEACSSTPNPVVDTPEGLVVPGEFEESQAVILRWTYGSTTSSRTRLYAELIDAIQQEAPAWIFINNGSDSTSVKNDLNYYGVQLENYKFLVKPTNSIWARDYGPWGFYYGEGDSLSFIDLQYYSSRPLDNEVPAWLASYMGVDVYGTDLRDEGGNLMVDGFGNAFHGTGTFTQNASINGWSTEVTRQVHQDLFNTVSATEADRLLCDGGTGHIDMYAKLLDEQTLLVTEYPEVVTASDRVRIEQNVALFEQQLTTFGNDYEIVRLPMPLRNDGTYSITCNQINADARGFVNGLLINKTFIVPTYSNETSPQLNRDWDEAALEAIRAVMPGYNVVGIDSRSLTTAGGAIHCITMQIPTDNPVRFRHERITGLQPALPQYEINAEIKNKSGIAEASVFWKVKGATAWQELAMTGTGNNFSASLVNSGFTTSDTIVYYLEATTNNGKTMAKPIVAPEGYFSFYFDDEIVQPVNCAVPSGLFESNIGAGNVTLNWSVVPDAIGYNIRGTVQGGSNFQTFNVTNGTTSSIPVNILIAGTSYQWQIRTRCSETEYSEWSPFNVFSTDACNAPSGLTAQNITGTSATLSWNAVPGATSYQLRGRNVGAAGYLVFNVTGGATSLNTGNQLMPNTDYEWSVRAYCNVQKTAVSAWHPNETFTTPAPALLAGNLETLELELYPNPSEGKVYASIRGVQGSFSIVIRDMTGREVYSRQYPDMHDGGTLELDMAKAAKGIYLVQVTSADEQLVRRLVIR